MGRSRGLRTRTTRLRAVLDTNVLLGADRDHFLFAAQFKLFGLVWSDFIEAEMRRVMRRMYWNRDRGEVLIGKIGRIAERVDHRQITGGNYDVWLTDPDDHPIMATALAGKVDYIVTSNTKDFPPKKRFAGITILTPDAFLRLLEG